MIAFFRLVVFVCLVVSMGGGCASPQMKGTPFYTGEYSVRQGPAEDRVNLWPLLYYREPALSLLWPIGEFTEDHLAIRPLMSIYGRDGDAPVYNVLWPYAQFNTRNHNHRIPPFFWGKDYLVGFPFYWHSGDPFGGGGYNALLPLWSYRTQGEGRYSTHLLWPFLHLKHWRENETGWRVWPLAGSYATRGRHYGFAAWPLAHKWSSADGESVGSCVLPFYYHGQKDEDSLFLSLPYSRGENSGKTWETVLPLYHRRKSEDRSDFYSLLYSAGSDRKTGVDWNLALPLWYTRSSPDERLVATLAGGYSRKGTTRKWLALPALSGGSISEDSGNVWLGGPLAHRAWDGEYGSHHVFPFYYRSRSETGSRFYSLLWSSGKNADESSWQLLLPFMFRQRDKDSQTLITPLYAQGSTDDGNSEWRSIVPLFFNRKTKDEHVVATLLGGYRKTDAALSWLAYPLLAGGTISDKESSFWAAAPLVHARWDGSHSTHHVLPLYYWNGWEDTFLSLPMARWRKGETVTTMVPPTLSWMTQREGRSDVWLLGALAHLSWGEEATSSHLFPLYYRNRESGTFASLLSSSWENHGTQYRLLPPLASLYTREGETRNLYGLLGLFRQQWGRDGDHAGHLLPLYSYRENRCFLTPLFGWNKSHDGYFYPLTPLVGIRRGDYSGEWIFPLWSRRKHREREDVNGSFLWGTYRRTGEHSNVEMLPFFGYRRSGSVPQEGQDEPARSGTYRKRFWSLPACWYRHETRMQRDRDLSGETRNVLTRTVKKHGFFPLWRYARTDKPRMGREDVDASLLLLLYDYKREVRKTTAAERSADEYIRRRVLWRLWHYEKVNEAVSVDVFPAITYDKKPDGFRKVSFLWRFFRYESGPGGRKMDVLFVPIIRKSGAEPDPDTEAKTISGVEPGKVDE